MDLVFNRRRISPNALRDLSNEIRERFGQSTKYVVHLKFKKTDGWDIFRYPFIFDTGAVLSYALSFLYDCEHKRFMPGELYEKIKEFCENELDFGSKCSLIYIFDEFY